MALIELTNITKTYITGPSRVDVLNGIDLSIDSGEYVAIMGRSGAGKSTLMNIMGCLDHPTTGGYELDGSEVSVMNDDDLSAIRGKTIGFVFQSFHLLKNHDVCDNVALPMEYQNIPHRLRRERAEELLTLVGLEHRLTHLPNELSGGERQRVAIARALSNRPKVVLADEPTGNLDSGSRDRILDLFERLVDETDVTLIMVTHDELIGKLARRMIIVDDGRIAA